MSIVLASLKQQLYLKNQHKKVPLRIIAVILHGGYGGPQRQDSFRPKIKQNSASQEYPCYSFTYRNFVHEENIREQ
jgi:hypothetical protein